MSFVLCTSTHVPTAVQINIYSISWTHVTRGIHGCVILTNLIMSRFVCACVHVCGSVRVVCVCVVCVCVMHQLLFWCRHVPTSVHISVDMNQLPYIHVSTSSNSSTHMYCHVPPTAHRCRQTPTSAHIRHTGGIRVTHVPATVHICLDMYHLL